MDRIVQIEVTAPVESWNPCFWLAQGLVVVVVDVGWLRVHQAITRPSPSFWHELVKESSHPNLAIEQKTIFNKVHAYSVLYNLYLDQTYSTY